MDKLAAAAEFEHLTLQRERFVVSENSGLGLLRLQTFHRKPGAVEILAERLGVYLPGPGETVSGQGMQWYWVAPGEWIIAMTAVNERETLTALQSKLDGLLAVLSVMTDSRVIFDLSGDAAREVLARGSTVDFHPSRFRAGHCISTRFAAVPVMLALPVGDGSIQLIADRSVGHYLFDWLEAASRDI